MIDLLAAVVRSLTALPPLVIAGGFVALMITLMGTTYQFAVLQVTLFVLPLSRFVTPTSGADMVRFAALFFAITRILSRSDMDARRLLSRLGAWKRPYVVFSTLTAASIAWSSNRGYTAVSLVGLAVCGIVIMSMSSDHQIILRATRTVIVGSVALSILYAVFPQAWVAGRLAGVFRNANSLGVFAMMASILFYRHWSSRQVPGYLLVMVALILSASRASGLGAIIGTLAYIFAMRRVTIRRSTLSLLTVFGAIAASLLFFASPGTSEILRLQDTRTGVWTDALTIGQSGFLQGIGGGAANIEAGSSPLRIFVENGLVGAVIILVLVVSAIRRWPRVPWQSAMLAALLSNSIFEAWFLVGGSGIFFVFILLTRFPDNSTGVSLRSRSQAVSRSA